MQKSHLHIAVLYLNQTLINVNSARPPSIQTSIQIGWKKGRKRILLLGGGGAGGAGQYGEEGYNRYTLGEIDNKSRPELGDLPQSGSILFYYIYLKKKPL